MKNWIQLNWFRVSILVILLVGVFGFISYINTNAEKEYLAQLQKTEENSKKEEQVKLEYTSKQKKDCLNIYEIEGKKWNNVTGWDYNSLNDTCNIEYKESTKKTEAECDEIYKGEDGKVIPLFFTDYLLCKDGQFRKSF